MIDLKTSVTALVLGLAAVLPLSVFGHADPASMLEDESEPKTTHHEVHDASGKLIGIQVVKTTRNCETYTLFLPIPSGE